MKSFLLTVTGILLSLAASLANIVWLTILSTVISLISAYAQFKDALPYKSLFEGSSWQGVEGDFKFVISKKSMEK